MKLEEFRFRFDELRRIKNSLSGGHDAGVIRGNVFNRLVQVVEAYLEDATAETGRGPGIEHYQRLAEERYDKIQALEEELDTWRNPGVPVPSPPDHESPAGDDHFYVAPDIGRHQLLAEVAAEIAAYNERISGKLRVPAEGQKESDKPTTGIADSSRSQKQEPEKPCKDCGKTKPLSGFPKNHMYSDGHTNKCRDCTRAYQRQQRASTREKREKAKARKQDAQNVTELPRQEERLCTAGARCVKADPDDLVPAPATLHASSADDHPSGLCRDCQKRAGVA